MATPPTAPPVITSFSGAAPNRSVPSTFSVLTDARLAEWQPNVDETNTAIAWENSTAQEVYDNALEAAQSTMDAASEAVNSAASAAASLSSAGDSADSAIESADSAIQAAINASLGGDEFTASSTTSLLIEEASKVFAIETGKAFVIGQSVKAVRSADISNSMSGQITAASDGSITVLVGSTSGSGTFSDWSIFLNSTDSIISTSGQVDYSADVGIPDVFVVSLNPSLDSLVATLSSNDSGDMKRIINISLFDAYVKLTGSNGVFLIPAGEVAFVFKVGVDWYLTKTSLDASNALIAFKPADIFNADNSAHTDIEMLTSTKFAVSYRDAGDSGKGKVIIGDISGSVITFGLEYVFNIGSTTDTAISTLTPSKIVISYSDAGTPAAIVADISGTVAAFGAEYVFASAGSGGSSAVALSSSKVVFSFNDNSNSNYGTIIVADISGTVISLGADYVFNNGSVSTFIIASALSSSKIIIAYSDAGNAGYGTAIVADISGTVATFGAEYVFNFSSCTQISTLSLSASKAVISYRNQAVSDTGTAIVADVSGTVVTFGSEYVFNADRIADTSSTALNSDKLIISYNDFGASNHGVSIIADVAGTVIEFSARSVFNAGSTSSVSSATLSSDRIIVSYVDSSNSNYGTVNIGDIFQ
tara:strand:- start:23652 stop:25595 length:1944 start_codon:yes stop_codon:yes gene_type:complete